MKSVSARILEDSKPKEIKNETVTTHPAMPDIKLGVDDNNSKQKNVYKF